MVWDELDFNYLFFYPLLQMISSRRKQNNKIWEILVWFKVDWDIMWSIFFFLNYLLTSPILMYETNNDFSGKTFCFSEFFLLLVGQTNPNGKTNGNDCLLGHFSTKFNKNFCYACKNDVYLSYYMKIFLEIGWEMP